MATLIYSAVPVLRVANVARSAAFQALVPDVGAIEDREHGCRELALLDPDGHVVVLGECG